MREEPKGGNRKRRLKGWLGLGLGFFLIWAFGFVIGPYIQDSVPTFHKIAEVVEEQDIDSGAYFYTEIKASYEGEAYLRQALRSGAPDQFGFTPAFISGIVICLIILALGFRFLPNEKIENRDSA
jgi:hypothetical protein